MKNSILELAVIRNDEWGRKVIDRIQHVFDLVAVDAKYHNLCMKKFYSPPSSGKKRGYRPATNVDEAMEAIYFYLEENSEECQFSLDDLMNQIEGGYRPDIRTVKSRLLQKYGDDILIVKTAQKSAVVCFRNTGYKLITDKFYANKSSDEQKERLRIV
ncbi:hypothetical protein RF55_11637 [Lasius niger]|uniref:Uncharacterized protein n=1 Tax=Lasius niger TaxID=67767 RepID=A0A0J7KEY1_LASNI|nr:hypothetical protein RF55_11637 [Lasius niger]